MWVNTASFPSLTCNSNCMCAGGWTCIGATASVQITCACSYLVPCYTNGQAKPLTPQGQVATSLVVRPVAPKAAAALLSTPSQPVEVTVCARAVLAKLTQLVSQPLASGATCTVTGGAGVCNSGSTYSASSGVVLICVAGSTCACTSGSTCACPSGSTCYLQLGSRPT